MLKLRSLLYKQCIQLPHTSVVLQIIVLPLILWSSFVHIITLDLHIFSFLLYMLYLNSRPYMANVATRCYTGR